MRKKTNRFVRMHILLTAGIVLASAPAVLARPTHERPRAESGVIDLRQWDFAGDGPVALNGEWAFYWRDLIDPADLELVDSTTPVFLSVPGYWSNTHAEGLTFPRSGYATYRVHVLLPESAESLAIQIEQIHTAYVLYADGTKISARGTVGTDAATSRPEVAIDIAPLPGRKSAIDLVLNVSNFHHRDGGIWSEIRIGKEADLRAAGEQNRARDVFVAGFILAMAVYYLVHFFLCRRDVAVVYFALFCLVVVVRTLVTGQLLLARLFPEIPWHTMVRLEYLSFYLAVPFFLMYLRELFPDELLHRVLRGVQIAGGVFALLVLVTPAIVYTRSVVPYQVVTLAAGLYALVVLGLAVYWRRIGARILLVGFVFLFVIVVNDVLHANQIVNTALLLPFGLLVFLFSQAYLIAKRSAMAFETIETQAAELQQKNKTLEEEIGERQKLEGRLLMTHQQLEEARVGMILGLAKLAECRDEDTGVHLERIREYCRVLASELAAHEQYRGYITPEYIEDLYQSSILHDIGKVGVPDSILLKPGKLTPKEFEVMKTHTTLGGEAIRKVESGIDVQSFLTLAKQIAYCHHEKWDGSGYPRGLKGKDIPLSARIVAVADVYDALTSERPYKKAFTHEKAKAIIVAGRASHFDPEIVDAFVLVETTFEAVRRRLQDIDESTLPWV